MVGFPALSCVFALAGVLVFGRFFLDKLEQPNGTPAKANALLGGLQECWAWSLCLGVWIHLLGAELKLKRSWCWVGALAACLLSLVSIWCLLFAQGECWPEIETQA